MKPTNHQIRRRVPVTLKKIYPSGPHLSEEAKEIAEQLGVCNFKASNGWLDKWKKRQNIRHMKISGELREVSGTTVASWLERVPKFVSDYAVEDI
uniref:HTH CENPB-type domain-containing protein n=1 Tax=Amphimedon queenslandica TaxID=400682 RepID=A0A1X7VK40_AMPQE